MYDNVLTDDAPNSWSTSFDVTQLQDVLTEYIEARELQARILGVLPRSWRKPIDVSVHYFLTHPLGRDYRQDALGCRPDTERFFFDPNITSTDPLVRFQDTYMNELFTKF